MIISCLTAELLVLDLCDRGIYGGIVDRRNAEAPPETQAATRFQQRFHIVKIIDGTNAVLLAMEVKF